MPCFYRAPMGLIKDFGSATVRGEDQAQFKVFSPSFHFGLSRVGGVKFKLRALPSLLKTFDAESRAPLLTNKKTPILTRHKTKKTMPTLTKLFSIQEVSLHNSKDDCWVVIDGKVYDVTTYLDDHPGGDEAILVATGKDATDDFEDAGHSNDARELMKSFCIGELDMSTIPELDVSFKKQQEDVAQKLMDLTREYWVVPVAIVGISVVASFLYMRQK